MKTLQDVLDTFAYHCGIIVSDENLIAFGIGFEDADGEYHGVTVNMTVTKRYADPLWDQVEVDGRRLASRSAARSAYAAACAPIIAAAAQALPIR